MSLKLGLMFVPLVGYFVKDEEIYRRGWADKVDVPLKWKLAYATENTLVYFLIGLWAGFSCPYTFFVFLSFYVAPIYAVVGPLEYALMKRKPHWFSRHASRITKFEFFYPFYHSFWFFMAGYFVWKVVI